MSQILSVKFDPKDVSNRRIAPQMISNEQRQFAGMLGNVPAECWSIEQAACEVQSSREGAPATSGDHDRP